LYSSAFILGVSTSLVHVSRVDPRPVEGQVPGDVGGRIVDCVRTSHAHREDPNNLSAAPESKGIAMNKTLLAAGAAALFATSTLISAQQVTTQQQLVGTWKVLTLKTTSGGKVSMPLGEHPAGYVSVTPTRIWLLFVDSTRKAPAAPTLTDAEAIAAMKSSVAWTVSTSQPIRRPMA
jgi:hypothetical protein